MSFIPCIYTIYEMILHTVWTWIHAGSTVNLYIQYISTAALIYIRVINSPSLRKLAAFHTSAVYFVCIWGRFYWKSARNFFFNNLNGVKAFRLYEVLRGRFTSNGFFFFSEEKEKTRLKEELFVGADKMRQQPATLSLWQEKIWFMENGYNFVKCLHFSATSCLDHTPLT